MMTVKKILTAILSAVFLSGCMYQADLRPTSDTSLIWVSKDPYAELEFNEEQGSPIGKVVYNKNEYSVAYDANYGAGIYMMSKEILNSENDTRVWSDFLWVRGRADYKRDGFDFQVKEDYVNMFDGELPLLKFKCYKKVDYFKEKQDE